MNTSRAAEVYKNSKQKENQILASNQVRILQLKIQELQTENRVLKNLLYEKSK